MRLISCEHPVTFIRDGKKVTVPCGHCALCKNKVAQNWVKRIQKECECWQFAYFITLTYDNEHLPVLSYDSKLNTLVDLSSGEMLDRELTLKEKYYCNKRKELSYPRTRDFQLFIKRLRYYFYEYNKVSKLHNKALRYFIATEYGPTTHRIHAHLILWFNDQRLQFASRIAEYVHKSWQNGNIFVESVQQSKDVSKYVAKYVNVDFNRFSLFKTALLRSKTFFSKCPPIGSMLDNSETIKTIFKSSSPTYRRVLSGKYEDVPLPYHIKNRLFPRLPKNERLNYIQRIGIYSISKWSGCETASEFVEWLEHQNLYYYDPYSLELSTVQDFLGFSPSDAPIFDPNDHFFINPVRIPITNYLYGLIDYKLKDPFYNVKNVFRISRRVMLQSEIFKTSIYEYVKKIDKYYSNVQLKNLESWYRYQESISKNRPSHPVGCFVYLDNSFIKNFLSYENVEDIPYWMMSTLWGYNINPYRFFTSESYRQEFNPETYPDVKQYIKGINFQFLETSKVKAKKDYLRVHPQYSYLSNYNYDL